MRRISGVFVILLLLVGFAHQAVSAQAQGSQKRGFSLKGNYPNPFNPTTTISFELNDELFEGGKPAVVSIRIFNVLYQEVAVPVAMNHPSGNGVQVFNLTYTDPGEKTAFWDGTDKTGRKVASGIYFYQLVVNGERGTPKKMVVTK